MNPFLKKLNIKIEKAFYQINRVTPVQVWYLILLLTILGSVFMPTGYFGPEMKSFFAFIWLFALVMVIFKGDAPPKTNDDSYMGLFFGGFIAVVFIVLVVTTILHYVPFN